MTNRRPPLDPLTGLPTTMLVAGYPNYVSGSGTLASAPFSGCNVFTYAQFADAIGVSSKQARGIINSITANDAPFEIRSLGHFTIIEKKWSHAPDRLVITHSTSAALFGERWREVQRTYRRERMRTVGRMPKSPFSSVSGGNL